MYVKEIKIENYGAIEKIDLKFPFDNDNKPLPIVLVGKNGTGKTLLLSLILHSSIELKRKCYNQISEVSDDFYYRIGSQRYIKEGKNFSFFKVDYQEASYIDFMTSNYEWINTNLNKNEYLDINFDNEKLKDTGFFSKQEGDYKNAFKEQIFLYFPVDRYYVPTWINTENKELKFIINEDGFIGRDDYGIVQYNILDGIEEWLLDVIIDEMLYESQIVPINNGSQQVFIGKNALIVQQINKILSMLYNYKGYKSVRFGVSSKEHRKIAIIGVMDNGKEEEIAPKFSNLSSGEIMVLGLFATIIKTYDQISKKAILNLADISGIVVIDEIDAHLHSDYLKDILPSLIKMFPQIQFIISSHSPFFLLGMEEQFGEKCKFVALPSGISMDHIENFDEVKKCYSIIDDSYNDILNTINKLENEIKTSTMPLIITEGKTDWKHLKHALCKFKEKNVFTDLEVKFQEYDYEFSDSKLETLLDNLSKVQHSCKIIGIFDSDSNTGKKYESIVDFGNNVFGCCITDTQKYDCGISIELLYKRDDLTRKDNEGRRIYLSDEFTEKSHQLKTDPTIVCSNKTIVDAYKRNIIKVVDAGVFNSEEKSLALSKEMFANYILNEDDNYKDIDVEGFKDIFNKILSILKESID